MSREQLLDLLRGALSTADADGTEIVAITSDEALTWYAENIIHQNVAAHTAQISVRAVVGKQVGSASTTDLTLEGIQRTIQSASDAARLMPEDPDFPGLPLPQTVQETDVGYVPATVASQPGERAAAVRSVIDGAEHAGLRAAGTYLVQSNELAVVSTTGVAAFHRDTMASLKAVVMGDDSSGYGYVSSSDVADIDPLATGQRAVQTAMETRNPMDVEPGPYDVVLSPWAVDELMKMMAFHALSARSIEEHTSFLDGRQGEHLVSPLISLYDDGLDPTGLPLPFDYEGQPKQRVDFISQGVAGDVVYDTYYAKKAGRASTGHSLQQPNDFGPVPLNFFMAAGESAEEEMVEHTERGIYVTRFWYANVVEPRQMTVTGMTRDGTYLIENGRRTRGIRNLRFTQSLVEMLKNTLEVGRDRSILASGFGVGGMVLPSLRVQAFHFTGATKKSQ